MYDGTLLSDLTGSISPATDNAQHYITGIKYSGARYTYVNLCTYTLTSSTQWKQSVKDDSSRTEFTLASQLQQLLLSNQMSELLNPIHELRTHCNEEHMPAPFS